MDNNTNQINEAVVSSLLAYFTSKEFLMAAGAGGALAAVITFLKGSSANVQKRFRKVAKMLAKMQLQFCGADAGLNMNKVLPGNRIYRSKDTGALGIIPFVERYKEEIAKDLEYLNSDFDSKLQSAENDQTKAEVCYAMLSSFCNKYFNMDVVDSRLRAKSSSKGVDENKYLIDTFSKIVDNMKETQSDEESTKISPFYSRVYKNYINMVDRYLKICNAIIGNFKKYTKIDGDDDNAEKKQNELAAAIQKFEAEMDKQRDGYIHNFYRVINTIISDDSYIQTVDKMMNTVIPEYRKLIENGQVFAKPHVSKEGREKLSDTFRKENTKMYDIISKPETNNTEDQAEEDGEEEFIFITSPRAVAEVVTYQENKSLNEEGEETTQEDEVKRVTIVKGDKAFTGKIRVTPEIESKLNQYKADDKKEEVITAKEDTINNAKTSPEDVQNIVSKLTNEPVKPEEKPAEENPENKPEEKPVENKPAEENPENKPEEKPAEETPTEETPVENKPTEETPAEDKPTDNPQEKPAEENPNIKAAEENPVDNKPADNPQPAQPAEQPAENKPEEKPAEQPAENKPEEKPTEDNKEEKPAQEQGLVKQSNQYLTRLSNNEVIKLGAVSQITELNGKPQEVQQDTFFKRLFNKLGNLLKKIYYFFVNRFGKYRVRVVPGTNAKPEVVTSLVHANNIPQQVDIYTIEMGQAEDGSSLHGTCDKDGNFILIEVSADGNVQILDKAIADRIRKEMENTENAKNFVLRKVNGIWQWVPIKQQQQVESINIEYSKLFNLAESFMGTLSYLNVHRNVKIDSKDNYYVLSENAWGDGSNSDPVNYLHKKLNESISNLNTYDDFVKYAKSSVSVNFVPVNEEEYKTSLPYNRYQMLTESNPLYESLLFVSFNNDDERTVKNMIKVQDIQKIVG